MNTSLKLVTVSLFFWGIGEGMFLLFQPIYLQKLGANPVAIGAILGGMGLMTTIAQIPSGYISDRFGTRPIMWASWILGTIAAWFMALAGNLEFFIIGLLLFGLTGSVMAPMNAYITDMRGEWSAERALTFTAAAYHLGTVVGPTLGGFMGQQFDLKILYLIAAIFFIISTLSVLFIKRPKVEYHHDPGQSVHVFKNKQFMLISILGFLALFFMIFTQSFTPVFLEGFRKLNLQQIGYLGTIGSLGNVLLALLIGNYSARKGYLIGFPLVFIFPLLILFGKAFPIYAIAYFFFGGYRLSRSMLLAFSRYFIKSRDTGLAYGVIETANGAAMILAPLICGLIYNQNPQWIFIIAMAGLGIIFLSSILWLPAANPDRKFL
jgi:MFS family permease